MNSMPTDVPRSPHLNSAMYDFLDWFRLEELFPIVALAGLLAYIGGELATPDVETYRRARRVTAAVFLLYGGMGIYTWGAIAASDVFVIALRALLAAGMAYGLSLLTLAPLAFVIGKLKALARSRTHTRSEPRPATPAPAAIIAIRDPEEDRRMERERMSKIEDARTLASAFYEEHAELLKEMLPPALFTTKIRTRFPDGISPEGAWIAANELISELVQLLKTASEQKRALEEQDRQRSDKDKEEDRKLQEAEARKGAIERLVEWKRDEEEKIRRLLPADGFDQDDAIRRLADRYDQLMQEALAEARP